MISDQEFKNLQDKVSKIELAQQTQASKPILPYTLDTQTIKSIERATDTFLLDKVMDLQWKGFFHYLTFFEPTDSTGGWGSGADGTGSVTFSFQSVNLTSGNVAGNVTSIGKQPVYQNGLLDWSQEQKFRTAIYTGAPANLIVRCTIGVEGPGEHYGFKIENGFLYGTVGNGTTQSMVKLDVVPTLGTVYELEAQLYPTKCIFIVDGVESGLIANNLPSQKTFPDSLYNNFILYEVESKTAASHTILLSYFEFISKRSFQSTNA